VLGRLLSVSGPFDRRTTDLRASLAELSGTFAVSGRTFAVSGRTFAVSGRTFAVSGRTFAVSGRTFVVSGRNFVVSGRTFVVSGRTFVVSGRTFAVFGRTFVVFGRTFVVSGRTFVVFGRTFVVFGRTFVELFDVVAHGCGMSVEVRGVRTVHAPVRGARRNPACELREGRRETRGPFVLATAAHTGRLRHDSRRRGVVAGVSVRAVGPPSRAHRRVTCA
jgi:hypothetical protein